MEIEDEEHWKATILDLMVNHFQQSKKQKILEDCLSRLEQRQNHVDASAL